jgi:cell surface protein SprA
VTPVLYGPQITIDLELDLLDAKLARNKAIPSDGRLPGRLFIETAINKVTIKGQPDLSRLRTIMLGVRNPLKSSSAADDDGLDKTGTVWFDELRLNRF